MNERFEFKTRTLLWVLACIACFILGGEWAKRQWRIERDSLIGAMIQKDFATAKDIRTGPDGNTHDPQVP